MSCVRLGGAVLAVWAGVVDADELTTAVELDEELGAVGKSGDDAPAGVCSRPLPAVVVLHATPAAITLTTAHAKCRTDRARILPSHRSCAAA